MALKVNLRVVMTENAKGEKIESIESIRRPEDEMCYISPPPGISKKKVPSTIIQFTNSEKDRKQSNQGRPI